MIKTFFSFRGELAPANPAHLLPSFSFSLAGRQPSNFHRPKTPLAHLSPPLPALPPAQPPSLSPLSFFSQRPSQVTLAHLPRPNIWPACHLFHLPLSLTDRWGPPVGLLPSPDAKTPHDAARMAPSLPAPPRLHRRPSGFPRPYSSCVAHSPWSSLPFSLPSLETNATSSHDSWPAPVSSNSASSTPSKAYKAAIELIRCSPFRFTAQSPP
uniref:Uncharacterized protein n=1 Tax=Setaria viridis TaxID=4556 RepID=A0A4U6TLD2_SETVI|nr:hypothetical protein SEVIR_8G251000v2 [Setaria viridis]